MATSNMVVGQAISNSLRRHRGEGNVFVMGQELLGTGTAGSSIIHDDIDYTVTELHRKTREYVSFSCREEVGGIMVEVAIPFAVLSEQWLNDAVMAAVNSVAVGDKVFFAFHTELTRV